MINPLEAVIAYLLRQPDLTDLVGTRIAAKHRYGATWNQADSALVVRWDGGQPDWAAPVQQIHLEMDCYAPTLAAAQALWLAVVGVTRRTSRIPVATSGGEALVHYFLQASSPSMLWDDELGLDYCLGFCDALVSE